MKGLTIGAATVMAGLLLMTGTAAAGKPDEPPGHAKKKGTVELQLLTVSDWHGQLTPVGGVGGAAFLKTYFDEARAANPNTLTFMGGDTFGNHNFDEGVDHLQRMVDLAQFDFVAANLENLEDNLTGVEKRRTYKVAGPKVAVISIVN